MKKIILFSVLAVLLASFAYADCYDSDDGPKNLDTPARYLGMDGFVTEGNNTYYDSCITRNGGVEINDSNWIREYFCDNGRMDYEDYFCPTYYYKECLTVHKAAACDDYNGPADYNETVQANTTNTTTTNTTSSTTNTNTSTPVNCGDKKVELGEDCDPPGKTCYTKSFNEGICDFSCACDSSMTMDMFKKLNQTINAEDEEENDTSVITFTVNETEESRTESAAAVENKTSKITGSFAADPITDLIQEAKEPPQDFSDSFGIKITSAVTSVVMHVWDLVMGLIGG